MISIYLID